MSRTTLASALVTSSTRDGVPGSEELDARLAVLHVGTAPVAYLLELRASIGGWGDDTRLD
jgi:hypothetical protein